MDAIRGGRFTSSKIFNLCKSNRKGDGFGSPAFTYIEEKKIERRLDDSIDGGGYSRPATWGNFMEYRVYELLLREDLGYHLKSQGTVLHPDKKFSNYWGGSCDFEYLQDGKITFISELKSYQKKKFAQYTDCLLQKDTEHFKNNFPDEYWQIVSNCIIHNVEFGEAISYMPYVSEHKEIVELVDNYDGEDLWKYRFIYEEPIEKLAFLKDGGYYKNLNRWKFQVPKADKDFLTNRVEMAIELLNE